jgi:hypothetical protein
MSRPETRKKTKEHYTLAVAERAERARVEMELLQLDLSNELASLAAVEKKIKSAQVAERKAKIAVTEAIAERATIRLSIRSAVKPYITAGASIEVAAAVTGMSFATLRNRNTNDSADNNVDNHNDTEHNNYLAEDAFDAGY